MRILRVREMRMEPSGQGLHAGPRCSGNVSRVVAHMISTNMTHSVTDLWTASWPAPATVEWRWMSGSVVE